MALTTPAELLQKALQLPADDRLALATELMASVEGPEDSEWAKAWTAELDQRVREVDTGAVKAIPWDQVKANIRARLRTR